jgi:tRNA G18 (ribose-2'-O)-methylase SpoU
VLLILKILFILFEPLIKFIMNSINPLTPRGFFGIGIYEPKTKINLGTLWRSANLFGTTFIFTIGSRYKYQESDTMHTERHIPLFTYDTFTDFYKSLPMASDIVAIELDENSVPIKTFKHPQRAVYLLGAEDKGIPESILKKCKHIVQLPGKFSLNVSVAGSIVMFDRINKI